MIPGGPGGQAGNIPLPLLPTSKNTGEILVCTPVTHSLGPGRLAADLDMAQPKVNTDWPTRQANSTASGNMPAVDRSKAKPFAAIKPPG